MTQHIRHFLILCILVAPQAFAQQQTTPLAPADQKALQQTQELLTDKTKRQGALQTDAAKKADSYAKSVGGEKHTEDIYAIASKVFEKLVHKYNGDSNKIAEVLEKAQKDPAAFANSEFSPEEIKALKELAGKLPTTAPSAK